MRRYTIFAAVFSFLLVIALAQAPQKAQAVSAQCFVFGLGCPPDTVVSQSLNIRCVLTPAPETITAPQSASLSWIKAGQRITIQAYAGSYADLNALRGLTPYQTWVLPGDTGSLSVAPTQTTTYTGKGRRSANEAKPCITTVMVVRPPQPTLTITANPATVVVGGTSNIAATFSAGLGDTLTRTAINNSLNQLWCGGGTCSSALWTVAPLGSKSYAFTPTAPGSYTFYPSLLTVGYPTWSNYGRSVTVTAACSSTTHQSGSSCVSNTRACTPAGAPSNSGTQTWTGSGWGACTAASCSSGYHLSGTSCVSNTQACAVGGVAGTRTWNSATNSFGACVINCPNGLIQLVPGGACVTLVAPPPSLPVLNSFSATRVRPDAASQLSWSISGSLSGITCSISGTPPVASPTVSANNGSTQTPPITQSIVYTLSCTNGVTSTSLSATAGLLPGYQ